MNIGNLLVEGSLNAGVFQRIYSNTLTSAATSITISGLNGDVDKVYRIKCRFVNGYNVAANFMARLNNDSGASNYGYQSLDGTNATATALRDTAEAQLALGYCSTLNYISMGEGLLYAKSGYVRTFLNEYSNSITGTTVTAIFIKGQSWNNIVDNISSIVVLADQTNGLGAGTVIELYALRESL